MRSSGPGVKAGATLALAVAMVTALLAPEAAFAKRTVAEKKRIAYTDFQQAERMREALNGKPESRRSARDYERVMDAFRKVYHIAPNSVKAGASIEAVAELMVEEGRLLDDEKPFKDAIGQYEFLRREYPGSKFRYEALFTIGEIYHDDLNDNARARATFEEFLRRYPDHELADQSRKALAQIAAEEKSGKKKRKQFAKLKTLEADTSVADTHDIQDKLSKRERIAEKRAAKRSGAAADAKSGDDSGDSIPEDASSHSDIAKQPQTGDRGAEASVQPSDAEVQPVNARHGKLPLLTSIRYWSTPDYTRVAIDLEQEVKYEAGRVPSPDRIFFDLHDTRLASEMVGKSYEVGDGFLRKIRVAQFTPSLCRVVLEVDSLAEYSAFLLPNPYRLIIDIHGKQPASAVAQKGDENVPPSGSRKSTATASEHNQRDAQSARNSVVVAAAPEKTESGAIPPRADEVQNGKESETPMADRKHPENGRRSGAEAADNSSSAGSGDDEATNDVPRHSAPDASRESGKDTHDATKELTEVASAEGPAVTSREVKATDEPTSAPTVDKVAPRKPSPRESARDRKRNAKRDKDEPSVREAQPTADGDRSLIRALGLKIGRIVVDAGHGGHDTGTIGPNGLLEKDLVLDVALRLGHLLEKKLGAEVIYTRDDDTFVPLETRTAIANKRQADLFISVHANSSRDPKARGVETYYLNFTSDPSALEVAARENAVSQKSVFELSDLVKKIAMKEKIEESREFATDVERSLHAGLAAKSPGIKDRGVKKAPFVVLIGANMPSILAEISFVSNPQDEKRLKTEEYRQRIAESLFRGVARYASGLSGVKVASKSTDTPGQ